MVGDSFDCLESCDWADMYESITVSIIAPLPPTAVSDVSREWGTYEVIFSSRHPVRTQFVRGDCSVNFLSPTNGVAVDRVLCIGGRRESSPMSSRNIS